MRPDRWAISSALVVLPLLLSPGASAQGADETLEERALNEETGSAVEGPSSAKPNRAPGRDWNFYIAPYGWLAGTAGHIYTNGERTDLDASFSDLAKKTRGGFQLYFEARHRKWFLAFDGTWATLGDEIEGLVTTTDIEVEQRIYDIRGGYEAYWKYIGKPPVDPSVDWRRRAIVDVYVGGRYFRTAPQITIQGPIGDPIRSSTVDSRIDPFVGLRAGWDMSYRWGMGFKADVGGFGIGDAAQFSWQATIEVGYRVSRRVSVLGGYRWLDFDTVTGDGENRNGQSLLQQGPIIGAGIGF